MAWPVSWASWHPWASSTRSGRLRSRGHGAGQEQMGVINIRVLAVVLLLAAPGDDPYLFGPLASRLAAVDVSAMVAASRSPGAVPIRVYAYRSQVLPETWHADVFLPSRDGATELRRGLVSHFECVPSDGRCSSWRVARAASEYVQTLLPATGAAHSKPSLRNLRRPIQLTGTFSDSELPSLITYIRFAPRPTPDEQLWVHVGPLGCLSGPYPIMSIDKEADGNVRVLLSESGGVGETAIEGRARRMDADRLHRLVV